MIIAEFRCGTAVGIWNQLSFWYSLVNLQMAEPKAGQVASSTHVCRTVNAFGLILSTLT